MISLSRQGSDRYSFLAIGRGLVRPLSLVAALWLCAAGAEAQRASDALPETGIVTIEPDRVYEETVYGQSLRAELEAARDALIAENARLEEELTSEERSLAEMRETMEPEAFRERADAFDAKVEKIREEQEEKQRRLTQRREEERQAFFNAVLPVLGEVLQERRAVLVLERRGSTSPMT